MSRLCHIRGCRRSRRSAVRRRSLSPDANLIVPLGSNQMLKRRRILTIARAKQRSTRQTSTMAPGRTSMKMLLVLAPSSVDGTRSDPVGARAIP
jgi:hypothetical protein